MAESANKKTPLGIDAFWTPDPPLQWEKWRIQSELTLLAKENLIIDTLSGPKPEIVELPLEPICKEAIVRSSEPSEREFPQRLTKDELAKQMPKIHRNRNNVWGKNLATCGSENSLPSLPEFRCRGTQDLQLQKS